MMESVKKAFALSVKALKLFYVIVAFNIIANIVNLMTVPAPADEMTAGKSFFVIILTVVISLAAVFIASGSLAYIRDLIKTGSAQLASFAVNGKKYFLRLLGVTVLIMLAFLILGAALVFITNLMPAALRVVMRILMIFVFIAAAVLFVMPAYALVGGDLGVIAALKKGLEVGSKNFLKILVMALVLFLIAIVITVVASFITGIVSLILRPLAGYIAAIVMAVTSAVLAVLVNLTYMDFYLKSA